MSRVYRHIGKVGHRLNGLCKSMACLLGRKFFTLHSSLFTLNSSLFTLHFSLLLLLSSCEYKDLCYDHNHWGDLRVNFDWQGVGGRIAPKGMTVLFYNDGQAAQEPIRYDMAGMEGGSARLLPATYQAAAYNYDTETILYRGMENTATLEAYTRLSSIEEGTQLSPRRASMPRAVGTDGQPVILEPDPLCAAASDTFSVARDASRTVTVMPHLRYKVVTVTITNVPNLQYTGQFGGALSGLAPSVFIESGQLGEGCVTQAFTANVEGETTLVMKFRIFGHCPHSREGRHYDHLLTVYAILADGSKWYYTEDVTSQLHPEDSGTPGGQDDDPEISIELDGLPVPKPIVNGSGFQPTVDYWQGIEIEVGM